MNPASMVDTTTRSSVSANAISSSWPSSLARCFNAPVQANTEAVALVELSRPC